MSERKIIAVVGATGSQGSGLVRAIHGDPGGGFTARALTRSPDSEKAKELAGLGAEVVAADVDDFKHDFEDYYTSARSLEESRLLNPSLLTFRGWLEKNRDRIPLE